MTERLKNIALILVVVALILEGALLAKNALANWVTEYNTTGYTIKLNK